MVNSTTFLYFITRCHFYTLRLIATRQKMNTILWSGLLLGEVIAIGQVSLRATFEWNWDHTNVSNKTPIAQTVAREINTREIRDINHQMIKNMNLGRDPSFPRLCPLHDASCGCSAVHQD